MVNPADESYEGFADFVDASREPIVICDVAAIVRPEAATLALLARLQMIARRRGRTIQLHRAGRRLIELIVFSGLDAVLPLYRGLTLEPGRKAEQREEPLDVEEVVDRLDPPV